MQIPKVSDLNYLNYLNYLSYLNNTNNSLLNTNLKRSSSNKNETQFEILEIDSINRDISASLNSFLGCNKKSPTSL